MSKKKDYLTFGCRGNWYKYEHNPVVGEDGGFAFDPSVVKIGDTFRMYYSLIVPGNDFTSIVFCESEDGLTNWSKPQVVINPRRELYFEEDVNRCDVRFDNGLFRMWYTAQSRGGYTPKSFAEKYESSSIEGHWKSVVCYASSEDGIKWDLLDEPVMVADQFWEKNTVMGPTVLYDNENCIYKMWYAAGSWAEPDAFGYAESKDGVIWEKYKKNPILEPDTNILWEQEKLAGAEVIKMNDWYYMFYIGFENLYRARIGLARSANGINDWERHRLNPILSPGLPESFDYGCVYKASLYYDNKKNYWLLYYNGSNGATEKIGIAIHPGSDFWTGSDFWKI